MLVDRKGTIFGIHDFAGSNERLLQRPPFGDALGDRSVKCRQKVAGERDALSSRLRGRKCGSPPRNERRRFELGKAIQSSGPFIKMRIAAIASGSVFHEITGK